MPARACVYVRVSALMGREGESFVSPALQAQAVRSLLTRRGAEEVAYVEDIDVSGRSFSRDGLNRVAKMAEAREFDLLAIYDLSRLGRNTREALAFLHLMDQTQVSILSTVEQFDDTPEGRHVLTLFLSMHQLYSDQIGRRWRSVHEHRLEAGLHHGKPPFGYRLVDRRLVVEPTEAAVVRQIYAEFLAGEAMWRIARLRRVDGQARETSRGSVLRILKNPTHAGLVTYGGRVLPGQHEAIVDMRVWERTQRALALRGSKPARLRTPTYALSGLAFCGVCGCRTRRKTQKAASPNPCLCCPRQGCDGFGYPQYRKVEDEVIRQVVEALRGYPSPHPHPPQVDVTTQLERIITLEAGIGRLAALHATGEVSDIAYRAGTRDLEAELAALRLAVAQREATVTLAPQDKRHIADRLAERAPHLSGPDLGGILTTLGVRVTLSRGPTISVDLA